jgi:hypothetical protein
MNSIDRRDGSDASLFAGTAWHYARYRPGHSPAFLDDLIQRLGLDGTGQLTLPLVADVAEASDWTQNPTCSAR